MTEEELENIASQLSCPDGDSGIWIGNEMNKSNINMTLNTIANCNILEQHNILELGHGNCGHLNYIFNNNKNIKYFGLEISPTMKEEAERNNQDFVQKKVAEFHLYDGLYIPFPDNYFHHLLTVNTIYFWKNPQLLLSEINRVLRKKGILTIAFAQKDFMESLPFVKYGFQLYEEEEVNRWAKESDLHLIATKQKSEQVNSKSGEMVNRKYTILQFQK